MDVWNWLILIGACLLLVVILSFLIVMAVKNKWIEDVYDTLVTAMKEAEETFLEPGSGKLKQDYVLAAVEKKCGELKIPFTVLKVVFTKLIDTIISHYNVIVK